MITVMYSPARLPRLPSRPQAGAVIAAQPGAVAGAGSGTSETMAEKADLIGIADALADIVYVVYGTALTYGIDLDSVLREVHRSNMSFPQTESPR